MRINSLSSGSLWREHRLCRQNAERPVRELSDEELQQVVDSHMSDVNRGSGQLAREVDDDAPGLRNFALRAQAQQRVDRIVRDAPRYREAVRVLNERLAKRLEESGVSYYTALEDFMKEQNTAMRGNPAERGLYQPMGQSVSTTFHYRGFRNSIDAFKRFAESLPPGDEKTNAFRTIGKVMEKLREYGTPVGIDLLYASSDTSFSYIGFQTWRTDHLENFMAPYRKVIAAADRGELKQDSPQVLQARQRIASMTNAREYFGKDPENLFRYHSERIVDFFEKTKQKPPSYTINEKMPDAADVREVEWALSSINAYSHDSEDDDERHRASRLISRMSNDLLAKGIIMSAYPDNRASEAQVGQRRMATLSEGERPGQNWIFTKTGPNAWVCPRQPSLTWSDAMMQSRTATVFNPRYRVSFQRVFVRPDTNDVLDRATVLDGYAAALRNQRSTVSRDDTQYYQLTVRISEAQDTAERLRTFNTSLNLPPERVLRHHVVRLAAALQAGQDERSERIQGLVQEINALHAQAVRNKRTTEATEALQCRNTELRRLGFSLAPVEVQAEATRYTLVSMDEQPNGMEDADWDAIIERRGYVTLFRAWKTARRAYVRLEDVQSGPAYDRALSDMSTASDNISRRYTRLRPAKRQEFEDILRQHLEEMNCEFTGFRNFGTERAPDFVLTYAYRGR